MSARMSLVVVEKHMDTPVTAAAGAPVTVTATKAIRDYFFGPTVAAAEVLKELKALTPEDKAELAAGAAEALGFTLAQ